MQGDNIRIGGAQRTYAAESAPKRSGTEAVPAADRPPPRPVKLQQRLHGYVRWSVLAIGALGLAIAYLDRSALSVAMPSIRADLDIDPALQGVILVLVLLDVRVVPDPRRGG